MIKKIRDFYYNFSDIIFALLISAGILFVLYTNIDRLTNVDANLNSKQETSENIKTEEAELKITVNIPPSVNVNQVASILKEFKIIDNEKTFVDTFKENDSVTFKTGDFEISNKATIEEIKNLIIQK